MNTVFLDWRRYNPQEVVIVHDIEITAKESTAGLINSLDFSPQLA